MSEATAERFASSDISSVIALEKRETGREPTKADENPTPLNRWHCEA
jgi:hypothetical protein